MKFSLKRKQKSQEERITQKAAKKVRRKERYRKWISFFFGDRLANSKLQKERWVVVLIVFMGLFYIANRYACMQEEIYIQKLQSELKIVRLDALAKKTELIEITTQTEIERLLRKWRSDVKPLEHPVYRIKR